MIRPTNLETRTYAPRAGHEIWTQLGPPGYLDSIQEAGTIAAPLLAGASFTLVALALQSATPFGRWQDLALLLLVAAGIAQVFAVQSVIWMRRYMVAPGELRQWFPADFAADGQTPSQWLANVQGQNADRASRWATWTRRWLNAGISLLLAGVAVGVVPVGQVNPLRWALIAVAWAGVAAELTWVLATLVDEPTRPRMVASSAAIVTSGGAATAAGFAATTGGSGSGLALWWAVTLAAVAVPFWLAALTDARFAYGRVWYQSPLTGPSGWLRAAAIVFAPVVFALATWLVLGMLSEEQIAVLSDLHPGVRCLLPAGSGLRAHHRAWSRCTALPVSSEHDLVRLLRESGQYLGPDGQPRVADFRQRHPCPLDCVVMVTGRDRARTLYGYFVVYPLTPATVERVRAGRLAGQQFLPADLAAPPADAAGWYIAEIWASGPAWQRGSVAATLIDALAASGGGGTDHPVFAPTATPLASYIRLESEACAYPLRT